MISGGWRPLKLKFQAGKVWGFHFIEIIRVLDRFQARFLFRYPTLIPLILVALNLIYAF